MKYIVPLFILILFSSCDNELELLEARKPIPIVYGLLDSSSSYQYIRVEKAFADADVPASEIAQIVDSLYFEDITVVVKDLNTNASIDLERVNGEDVGLPRGDGAFAATPNYLYRYKTTDLPVVSRHTYQLEILGISDDRSYTATMEAIDVPFFTKPSEGGVLRIAIDKSVRLTWSPPNSTNIASYNVLIHSKFIEHKGSEQTEKVVTWLVEKNTESRALNNVSGTAYFQNLRNELTVDPNVTREFKSLTIELVSAGINVADYLRVTNANLGITSSGEIPTYTNISNGLGIFGSKHTHIKEDIGLSGESFENLVNSDITKDLNFYQ